MAHWEDSVEDWQEFVLYRLISFPVQFDAKDILHDDFVFSRDISPIVRENIVSNSR